MLKRIYQAFGRIVYYLSKPWQWFFWARRNRCYVVIECGGKVLVVMNWLGKGEWSLPGGGAHKGEDLKNAALREVYEETAIRLPEALLEEKVSGFTKYFIGGKNYHVFEAKLQSEPDLKRRPREILDARWVAPTELAVMPISEEVRAANLI